MAPRLSRGKVSYAGMDTPDSDDESENGDDAPVARPKQKKTSKRVVADSDDEFDIASSNDEEEEVDDDVEVEEEDASAEEDAEMATSDAEATSPDAAEGSEAESTIGANDPEPEVKPKPKAKRASAAKGKGKSGGAKENTRLIDENLPPIFKLDDIFSDLLSKVNLDSTVKQLNGRKMRIGTMCSGTESPLLALGIISKVIGEVKGQKLEIEHIFSCEIVPFKQAYIERNFSPPFLFRDVTELGDDQAVTAYGGLAEVPGNIDILVAGTSCVDYSPLNRKQKTITGGGESGRTFFGMLDYVVRHRPKIIILENVSSAPWGDVADKFQEIGYYAEFVRLDTKSYYIPHTRTRGYLIATLKESGAKLPKQWSAKMDELRRPASVSLEAFLLPTDDPRVARARAALSTVKLTNDGGRRAPTDWAKCESRHHRAREEEALGQRRYLTGWQDGGGKPQPVEGLWANWLGVQTERVTDLIDIAGLRKADVEMVDVQSKAIIWNLSQNVDRTIDSKIYGITPCLTPNMIPFLTVRGGPLIGQEALSLQGIPIDLLLLTRETEDNLADLAGNAMSSTVVGSAILAALHVAGHTFKREEDAEDVKMDEAHAVTSVEKNIKGEERLVQHAVNLSSVEALSTELLDHASQSARKCECEGRRGVSKVDIFKCTSCRHSTCANCRARPQHSYVLDEAPRIHPDVFETEVKKALPMRFKLEGFGRVQLNTRVQVLEQDGLAVDPVLREKYLDAVSSALGDNEFHFGGLTRRALWTATFANAFASLELIIDPTIGLTWSLSVKADPKLAANDRFRAFLNEPVARLVLPQNASSFVDGVWDLRLPVPASAGKCEVTLKHVGPEVPSWRSDLGLLNYLEETRAGKLEVTSSESAKKLLDRNIDGEYVLHAQCATPTNALYRRVVPDEEKPLYLFFDPNRSGEPSLDHYVFADTCDKLDYGSFRGAIAHLPPGWWPKTRKDGADETKALLIKSAWVKLPGSGIQRGAADADVSSISMPATRLDLSGGAGACSCAQCLLTAHIRLSTTEIVKASPEWHELDLAHEGPTFFAKTAWVFARLPAWSVLQEWQKLDVSTLTETCETCCPPPPPVLWVKASAKSVNAVKAFEDGQQAAKFEHALKARPSPVLVHTRQDGEFFDLRIGLNVATLAHKALGSLPTDAFRTFEKDVASVEWRLTPAEGVDLDFGRSRDLRKFLIPSNKDDPKSVQPPHFKKALLRPEQLRSLTWMIAQEVAPTPWIEEEVAEAILSQLSWHAEAKARRPVHVRGGVLADEVGYGKTAITVGLISARLADTVVPDIPGRIGVKATLIIVPAHLTSQWPSEIKKFAGPGLNVIVIKDMNDLKKKTIRDVQDADVLVVADSVLKGSVYWPYLGAFSGVNVVRDERAGRFFRNRVDEATRLLGAQVDRLRNPAEGPTAALQYIVNACKNPDVVFEEPSKRLKGQAYAEEKKRQEMIKKHGLKDDKKPVVEKKKVSTKGSEESDVWGLGKAKKDWTSMHCPPLSMFAFNRLVIDEFTYLMPDQLAGIRTITASSRWILSGTPPLKDFGELKTIATLLQVHLGVDDENETTDNSVRNKKAADRTAAETFHSFREVRTAKWHKQRDDVGQRFLDHFVRQNLAEIEEIVYSESIIPISLPAAETAIYSELYHHLMAFDENLQKIVRVSTKKGGDRELRLSQALGDSASPEEALLKRSSHFSLDMEQDADRLDNAVGVCGHIHDKRVKQSEECKVELVGAVRLAAAIHSWLLAKDHFIKSGPKKDQLFFQVWIDDIFRNHAVGDDDAAEVIKEICAKAGCADGDIPKWKSSLESVEGFKEFLKPPKKGGDDAGPSKETKEEFRLSRVWALRELVHRLRRLQKELVGRTRSQRCFAAVRDAQLGNLDEVNRKAILTSCGHTGVIEDVVSAAERQACIVKSCRAPARTSSIVHASTLCNDAESGTFGAKLQTLVNIVSTIPDTERVLVFVQFPDLMIKVREALVSYGIPTTFLAQGAKARSETLNQFQNSKDTDHKVMVLEVTDASASGANLTVANTAIFISPMLASSVEQYRSWETQAIGRLRRYGQLKPVKVYRLLSKSTIDYDIYEERSGTSIETTLAAQLLADANSTTFPKTTLPMNRVYEGAKGPKAKKAKKANDDDESGEEDSAADTDEEPAPRKKKAAPKKPAPKGKGKAKSDDEDDSEPAAAKPKPKPKKAPAKKAAAKKAAVESDDDDEVVVVSKAAAPKKEAAPIKPKPKPKPKPKGHDKNVPAASTSTPAPTSSAPGSAPKAMFSIFNSLKKRPSDVNAAASGSGSSPKRTKTAVYVSIPPLTAQQKKSLAQSVASTTDTEMADSATTSPANEAASSSTSVVGSVESEAKDAVIE